MDHITFSHRAARLLARLSCFAAALLVTTAALADENKDVAGALNFTRGYAEKHHLVAAVQMRDRKGKLTAFQYDRVADVERLRKDGETFARKGSGSWMKSDDWGESGAQVQRDEAEELEQLGDVVEGILKTKDDPALRTWHAADEAKSGDGRRHIFKATRGENGPETYPRLIFEKQGASGPEALLLTEAVGPVFVGGEVMVATIRFAYGNGADKGEVAPPQMPTPTAPLAR